MAFEILLKKLQVKDTEAYQEMMRINYEAFWGISMAILVILPLPFRFEPVFGKTADHHSLSSSRSNSKNYHVEFGHVQTT